MTHSKLDVPPQMLENDSVNLTPSVISCAAALLPLLLAGCNPQSADPQQLGDVIEQNAKLRSDISRMEALIRQAGEPEPDLPDRIARREQELGSSKHELKALIARRGDEEVRAKELEGRLDAFRDRFSQMKKELSNASQP